MAGRYQSEARSRRLRRGSDLRNGLAPAASEPCSRRHHRRGKGADVPIAQAVVDQCEQLAGDRDGGDVTAAGACPLPV